MPKPLLDRLRPDSIAEFRLAASERYRDGEAAATNDRRTAAIYLWGYAAEMTIKAAYFSIASFRPTQNITRQDLDSAKTIAIKQHQVNWTNPRSLHNVAAWAELLIKIRPLSPLTSYGNANFGAEVQTKCRVVQVLWSEQLRYHKNVAYQHEVDQMKEAVDWLLNRSLSL